MRKRISASSISPPRRTRRKASARDCRTRKRASSGRQGNSSTNSKPAMAYLVNITARAERDLTLLFNAINVGDSEAALKWYRGLRDAIFSLEGHPNRCPTTREKPELRNLLCGNKPHIYRVIYRVLEKR